MATLCWLGGAGSDFIAFSRREGTGDPSGVAWHPDGALWARPEAGPSAARADGSFCTPWRVPREGSRGTQAQVLSLKGKDGSRESKRKKIKKSSLASLPS